MRAVCAGIQASCLLKRKLNYGTLSCHITLFLDACSETAFWREKLTPPFLYLSTRARDSIHFDIL